MCDPVRGETSSRWQVFCGACGSSSGSTKTREEAIELWNRRTFKAPAVSEAIAQTLADRVLMLPENEDNRRARFYARQWLDAKRDGASVVVDGAKWERLKNELTISKLECDTLNATLAARLVHLETATQKLTSAERERDEARAERANEAGMVRHRDQSGRVWTVDELAAELPRLRAKLAAAERERDALRESVTNLRRMSTAEMMAWSPNVKHSVESAERERDEARDQVKLGRFIVSYDDAVPGQACIQLFERDEDDGSSMTLRAGWHGASIDDCLRSMSLRASPAPLCTVDVDGLAAELAKGYRIVLEPDSPLDAARRMILSFTREVDAERLASVLDECRWTNSATAGWNHARAVLSDLGLQLATPQRAVSYHDLATAIDEALVRGRGDERPDCDIVADAVLKHFGMTSVGRPQTEEEAEAAAPASPSAQAGEWTEEQRADAQAVSDVVTYGWAGRRPLATSEAGRVCATIARVAPGFVAPIRLPECELYWTPGVIRAALRAHGLRVEGSEA
jgi:hypothetical protein